MKKEYKTIVVDVILFNDDQTIVTDEDEDIDPELGVGSMIDG